MPVAFSVYFRAITVQIKDIVNAIAISIFNLVFQAENIAFVYACINVVTNKSYLQFHFHALKYQLVKAIL